jgi:putative ABC transport system permease protein
LAAVGIYGVMAYSIQQRTQEIGIRMALGAVPHAVLKMVVLQGVRLSLAGIGLGLVVSLALTRSMTIVLSGVRANDYYAANAEHLRQGNLRGFVFAVVLLSAAASIGAYIPARRASRMNPMTALRHE